MPPTPGLRGSVRAVVAAADTARALGSGDVEMLGTPRLVALAEAATVAAVAAALEPGRTTVGTRVEMDHLAPSPVGATILAEALLTAVAGRRLTFEVTVTVAGPAGDAGSGSERGPGSERGSNAAGGGSVVGRGVVTRVVVDRARFGAPQASTDDRG